MYLRYPFSFVFSVILALTVFLGTLFPYPSLSDAAGQTAVMAANAVNIRNGPGTNYGIITQVDLNERLPVLDKSGDWYNVQLASGDRGWVAGWLVKVEMPQAPAPAQNSGQVAVVNGSSVNVRSGPGTGYEIITQVGSNERFPVLDKSGGWFKIMLNTGAAGWMAGWLVNIETAGLPLPSPVKPPVPSPPSGNQSGGKVAVVTGSVINVRSGPGTSNGVIGQLFQGDNLYVLEQSGDWYRIITNSAGSGWVAGWLVSVRAAPSETPHPPVEQNGNNEASRGGGRNTDGFFKGKVVAVDAGHGGPDSGAIGSRGTMEKEVALAVAQRIAKLLEARGAKVIMTRPGDQDVGLYERTDKENYAKADIFVSVHINSNTNPSIGGTTSYIYNGKENTSQIALIPESARLARYVQAELLKTLGLRDLGVRDANFVVLRTSNMPAILIETAFISNAAEEKIMRTDDFRNKAAEAIVRGIGLYFSGRRTA